MVPGLLGFPGYRNGRFLSGRRLLRTPHNLRSVPSTDNKPKKRQAHSTSERVTPMPPASASTAVDWAVALPHVLANENNVHGLWSVFGQCRLLACLGGALSSSGSGGSVWSRGASPPWMGDETAASPFPPGLGVAVQKSCWGSSWAPPRSLTPSSQFRVSVSESAFPGHSNRSRNSSLYRALTLTLCPTPTLMCFFCLMEGPTCWNRVDILGWQRGGDLGHLRVGHRTACMLSPVRRLQPPSAPPAPPPAPHCMGTFHSGEEVWHSQLPPKQETPLLTANEKWP